MTTIDDIEPKPCDKTEIHYPHGWIDSEGAHACQGVANEEEQQKLIARLSELKAKVVEIEEQAAKATQVEYDAELVGRLSQLFGEERRQRHEMGALKYGPVKFMEVDSLEEAIQEVLDMANYAEYTYIKLRLLQLQLAEFETLISALRAARDSGDLVVSKKPDTPTFVNPFRKD